MPSSVDIMSTTPITHNCCLANGLSSPLIYSFLQKYHSDQNLKYADTEADITRTFLECFWAPSPHLLVLPEGLTAKSMPHKRSNTKNKSVNTKGLTIVPGIIVLCSHVGSYVATPIF